MTTESPYFLVFPELPSELRLKIWGYAISTPRTIEISCERGILATRKRYAKAFHCASPPPSVLHVCRESRFEALNVYQPLFTTKHSPKYIYVSFDMDIIRFPDGVLPYVGEAEFKGIQKMSLHVTDYSYFAYYNMDILKEMQNLKELELLAENGPLYGWNPYNQYVITLKENFEESMTQDPEWECPRVRIVSRITGEEVAMVEGGAEISKLTADIQNMEVEGPSPTI